MSEFPIQCALYRNHKGEIGLRKFRPIRLHCEGNQWHPAGQLQILALDVEKNVERDFLMHNFLTPWKQMED